MSMATSASPHQMHAKHMPWAVVKASPVDEYAAQQGDGGAHVLQETQGGQGDGIGCRREQDERNCGNRAAKDEKPVVLQPETLVMSPRNP